MNERILNSPKTLTGFPLAITAIALSLATFLIVLDYSIANVSIPYIAGDLAVSADQGIYVITSFAVGSAIVLPLSGWLAKRVGLVRITILSMIGFILFSWICGISKSLTMMVIARFLQGAAAGPLVPTSQSLTISIFPPDKKAFALGFWSTVVIVAPIVGPVLGGWISYDVHWPWIFFLNIPIGLFCIFIMRLYLKPYETPIERPSTDWMGLIFLAIGVSSLQFLLDKGEQFDWLNSPIIRVCAAASIICFVLLIAWELTQKDPLLELRLLKIHSFALSIIFIGTMYALYFGGVVLVPLWLQEYMNYTPIWAGVAVAPIGIVPILCSWLIARMTPKTGNLIPLGISVLFFAASCFMGAYFNTEVDLFYIALARFIFGIGVLFFVVPVFGLCVRDVSQEKLPQATGMFHFVRAMAGGVGTSIFTTLWIRRRAFHHSNIVSTINWNRPPVNEYYAELQELGIQGEKAFAVVNTEATNQAAMLGLNDCFFLMGWIFIGLLAIIIVGKRKKRKVV